MVKFLPLRYGENPHQRGVFWPQKTKDPLALGKFKKIQGKELSFNNFLDLEAGISAICEISQEPACVIIKHTNPSGMAKW